MSIQGKVKWGILSTAKIGVKQVIPAMQNGEKCEVAAIASRNEATAKATAEKLGIPQYYGSYEALLDDPEIDAIYNPLPNHMHFEWTKKCMEKGKHVLCEKPITLTSEEVRDLMALSKKYHVKVGEAFMVRCHPQWLQVKQRVTAGDIGQLKLVHGFFSYHNLDPHNIRNIAEYGGGSLWDIGCYPIMQSRYIFGEEPKKVVSTIAYDPDFGTDVIASAILVFPSGRAVFSSSTQLVPYQRMQVFGDKKMIEVKIPFNPPNDISTDYVMHLGDKFERDTDVIQVPAIDQYTQQGDAFSEAILSNTELPVSLEDSYGNVKVIEALFASAKSASWVDL